MTAEMIFFAKRFDYISVQSKCHKRKKKQINKKEAGYVAKTEVFTATACKKQVILVV